MGDVAKTVPQGGDWETIASKGELLYPSGAHMERVGEGDGISCCEHELMD